MTLHSPLDGTTPSCGRIENSPAQPVSHHPTRSPQPLQRRRLPPLFRFRQLALALLLAAITGCSQRDHSGRVELVIGSSPLTPTTTFELRFDSIMVKGDQVGQPAAISPLVIRPHRAGTFTWLSSRTGLFTPTEPLALNTSYELSLQPGLTCADGRTSDATLHRTVTTPAFGVITAWPRRADSNACSIPEIKLAFNA